MVATGTVDIHYSFVHVDGTPTLHNTYVYTVSA